MKKWLKTIASRFGDLVVKLISVKTIAAAVVTWMGFKNNSVTAMIIVGIFWSLVIGIRYAEKVSGIAGKLAKFGGEPTGSAHNTPSADTKYGR